MIDGKLIAAEETFDYGAPAELFPVQNRASRRQSCRYWRFDRAAEAISFAIEKLSPKLLASAYLEVNEIRFDSKGIRSLYDRVEYPLARHPRAQVG
jgi:hypothetical protein